MQRALHGPVQHRILQRPAVPARQAKGAPAVAACEKRGPVLLGAERLLARRARSCASAGLALENVRLSAARYP